MKDLLLYFLKVNGSIILFYLFYILLYRRDTFWKIRRAYLLVSVLFSFLYPLLQFGEWFQKSKTVEIFASAVNLNELIIYAKPAATTIFTTENMVWAVYVLIAFALLFKIGAQIISILLKIRQGEQTEYNGVKLIHLNKNITPFSFFSLIFINKNLHTEEELPEILAHELSHVRQRHSYDVILSEIATALCWFNPFAWLLKKELKQNLEFLADNHVINAGFEAKKYQYLLLNISCNYVDNQLINQFNISPIKKRITMMNKQKTSGKGLIKYTLIIPVALTMLIISNAQNITANVTEIVEQIQQVSKQTPKKENAQRKSIEFTAPTKKTNEKLTPKADAEGVFSVVDVPPSFPGGEAALMKFLANNIKYPVEAQKKNIQGKVIVGFVIDETGKIMKATIARGVHPALDAEALRVIKTMPDWTPGKQGGVNVAVRYYLPVIYKLSTNDYGTGKEKKAEIVVTGKQTSAVKFTEPVIKKDDVFDKVDVPPVFPGGDAALMNYLSENIKYPVKAQEVGAMGKVIVKYIIDADGNVTNPEVAKTTIEGALPNLSVNGYGKKGDSKEQKPAVTAEEIEAGKKALENEALRVVKSMPKWTPGKLKGKNVKVSFYLPVNFRLQ